MESSAVLLGGYETAHDGDARLGSASRCTGVPQGHEGVAEGRGLELTEEATRGREGE